ncbi:MAG: hypothetical protein IT289_12120 [Oligoflexia bacterium]|nr:hypothetical protein [Oligoflexia bacterium]
MKHLLTFLILAVWAATANAKPEISCPATKQFPYSIQIQSVGAQPWEKVASIKRGKQLVYQNKVRLYDRSTQKDYTSGNLFNLTLVKAPNKRAKLVAVVSEKGDRKFISDGSLACKIL